MQITSDQIRAARALVRLDQTELARRAGVAAVTVRRLEAGGQPVGDATIASVAGVLEDAGVEFIDRGVRRRSRSPEEIAATLRVIEEIVGRSATALRDLPPFAESDLYDENGLPR